MFPQYLFMGMTYEQYWEGSPQLAVAYRKAYELKRKADNEQAWLHGMYVCDAFAVVLQNAFKKRGQRVQTYLEKPIDIFPLTEKEKKRKEAEQNRKMQQAMEQMIRKQRQDKKHKGD